ncbi:DUF938 domain-containing protein [soil metagenome]
MSDARLSSPAALRNRDPILDVLRSVLPARGTVLEIASGSGEHITYFAAACRTLTWQPSDPSAEARASIAGWLAVERPANVLAPLALDASAPDWPVNQAEAILAINMVHISPWDATLGLLAGASRLLPAGRPLFLYGPYRRGEAPLAPSNAAFDADLKARNPDWGIRDLDTVAAAADTLGLSLDRVVEMPANNLSVVFVRR